MENFEEDSKAVIKEKFESLMHEDHMTKKDYLELRRILIIFNFLILACMFLLGISLMGNIIIIFLTTVDVVLNSIRIALI